MISLKAPKTKSEAAERRAAKRILKEEKRQIKYGRRMGTYKNVYLSEQLVNTTEYNVDGFEDENTIEYEELNLHDISYVDGMDGHEFEYFCADLLRQNGFVDVSVTPGSGDQGVDILAEKGGVKYAVQCKNYAFPLSNTPVQEVNAGKTFYGCHVGVVMTNSTFTSGAINLAKATGVLLWGRDVVQEMMR